MRHLLFTLARHPAAMTLAGTALLIKDYGFAPVLIGLAVVFLAVLLFRLWQRRRGGE